MTFDVVVIGGGHAGCEAALAANRLGARVAMFTLRLDRIAHMSCNPAVGGVGKSHLVREVDALGGAMGEVADATAIQFRTLNASRGPAVRSTRVQSDSDLYAAAMRERVANTVTLIEDEVVGLMVDDECEQIRAVVGKQTGELKTACVILTSGTFLNGLCHIGDTQFAGGRVGDGAASELSAELSRTGHRLGRFKTGTTPRLARESIDWS